MNLKSMLLNVLSGLLLGLSYPGYGLDFLIWVALVPLMISLKGQSNKSGFWAGWQTGFVYFLLILPWLLSLWDWANVLILLGYVGLSAGLAVLGGFWGLGFAWFSRGSFVGVYLFAPACWVLLEFIRSSTSLGFAWGIVGHALTPQTTLVQLAAWTGVWGLSFLVVLTNVGLYFALTNKNIRHVLFVGTLLLGIGLLSGWHRQQIEHGLIDAPTLDIVLIQPNIPQKEKSNPSLLDPLRERYRRLLDQIDQPIDLIILPESILPTLILEDPDTFDMLTNVAKQQGAALLFGAFTRRENALFNSSLLMDEAGAIKGQYDKVQLVPFSTEYFPFIDTLKNIGLNEWLGALPLGSLKRGQGFNTLELGQLNIGTPICFESSFGRISRALVNHGANLLITITNDAWFKQSIELEQHFAMGILRAVETGRSFVQVANTGTSGVILPTGERFLELSPHQAKLDYATVPLLNITTFYLKYGDWFVGVLVLLFVIAVVERRFRGFSPSKSA